MEVFNELLAEIELIPAVDVLSHVDASSPAASDLSSIVGERGDAAGLESLQCTSAYWCATQIAQDLFQVEHSLHQANLEELAGKVKQSASEPGWVESVLGRANVSHVMAACDWYRAIPEASGRFASTVRLDQLVNEPFARKVIDKLSDVTGQNVYEAREMSKAVGELLYRAKTAGAKAVNAWLPPQAEFDPGNRDLADRVISLVLLGQKTDRDDRRALRSFAMDQILRACAEHGLTFQLSVGTRRVGDDSSITASESNTVAALVELVTRHSQVTFDMFASHPTLASEFASAATACPNLNVSGAPSFVGFPVHIRRALRERIEVLPMGRSCALASGSDCVEWVYARAALIRRELAFVLAEMIREGYITRGAAAELARHYLQGNPKRIYNLV